MKNNQTKPNPLPNLPKISIFDKSKNSNSFTGVVPKTTGPQAQTKVNPPQVRITQNKGGS